MLTGRLSSWTRVLKSGAARGVRFGGKPFYGATFGASSRALVLRRVLQRGSGVWGKGAKITRGSRMTGSTRVARGARTAHFGLFQRFGRAVPGAVGKGKYGGLGAFKGRGRGWRRFIKSRA